MSFHSPSIGTDGRPDLRIEEDDLAGRRARGHDRSSGLVKGNLPHPRSGFVGRQGEIAEVGALLGDVRLLTLTGPGGVGKTRLALEVAGRAGFRYRDGVRLVELGSLTDPGGLPAAVAGALPALSHPTHPTHPTHPAHPAHPAHATRSACTAEEVTALIGRRHLLLVLDNCEHLVGACAHLVEHLLRSCPELDILATSREGLGLAGEHIWPVRPLSLPDGAGGLSSLTASDAGALFLQRACEANPRFSPTGATAGTIAEICRRVDGLPLAVELAAMRIPALSPADILERLDDRFRLLSGGGPTAPVRHRSLLGALEWSHDLLAAEEAVLLRRLSVFTGWTLRAAEEVCAGDRLPAPDVVDLLATLVGKSLVVAEERDERIRYHLLESTRVWAASKLDAEPEADGVRRAHALWCVRLAEEADDALAGRHPKPWLDELDAEAGNLRSAMAWARAAGEIEIGLRLVTALARFWRLRGDVQEAQRWLGWAVIAGNDVGPVLRAKALRAAGLLRGQTGDIVSALPLLERSSALYAEAGDEEASLCPCTTTFLLNRNPRQALPVLEEKAQLCRRGGDLNGLSHLLHSIGQVHFVVCATDDARRHFQECVQLGRGAADTEALRSGLLGLARLDLLVGDLIAAEGWAAEAKVLAEAVADVDDGALALELLGDVARSRGRFERARGLLAEGLDRARDGGWPIGIGRALYFLARLAEAEGDPEAGALFERSLAVGRAGEAPIFHEVRCRVGLGTAAERDGDLDAAAGHLLEALETSQGVGDLAVSAEALQRLSVVARRRENDSEAGVLAQRALELSARVGTLPGIATSLELLAGLAAEGRPEVALRLLAAAQAAREPQGLARSQPDQARHDLDLARLRCAVADDAFAAAWAEGAALSADEAVAYALRGRRSGERPVTGWESLTSAEKEVVRLVCEGLSNPEVGRRLFISPRTVGHHLTHVFDKLGVRSRGALARALAGRDL